MTPKLATPPVTTVTRTDTVAWWRLWAVAALAHALSNSFYDVSFRGLTIGLVGLVALALMMRPERWHLRVALSASILLSVWAEAPLLGNHWLLAGLISLVALAAQPWRDDWLTRAAPGMRVTLLVFYSFAAFAKLNSGFFDRSESCAVYFANRTLELWRLPQIQLGSSLAAAAAITSVVIELSVPILLVWRRTRRVGVPLAILFHFLLTFDLRQHFFDFTMVLIPLFLLFTAPGTLTKIDGWWTRLSGFLTVRAAAALVGWLGLAVVGAMLPVPDALQAMVILTGWATWLAFGTLLVVRILRTSWTAEALTWSLSPLAALIVAITVLNGLSPYLGLKTSTSFNMYSNLVTGDGESNHYLITQTASLRPSIDDLVVITATSDPGLSNYIDSGLAVPFANLTDYLADHQDASVTYERDGVVTVVERAGDHPQLVKQQPILVEKFAFVRAVPTSEPTSCLPSWFVAG